MLPPEPERWLAEAELPLRLSCWTPSGWPAVLSLWYLYRDGRLHCATQRSARVVAYLRHDPRCAFEVSTCAMPYRGVRGRGRIAIDAGAGEDTLVALLTRYLGGTDSPLARRLLARAHNEVALVITPERWNHWDFTERMKGSV